MTSSKISLISNLACGLVPHMKFSLDNVAADLYQSLSSSRVMDSLNIAFLSQRRSAFLAALLAS